MTIRISDDFLDSKFVADGRVGRISVPSIGLVFEFDTNMWTPEESCNMVMLVCQLARLQGIYIDPREFDS